VTDRIETFTEKGIKLVSGAELEADLIVTATGLKMMPLGRRAFHRRWPHGRCLEVPQL
jgi:monooxygenase